MNALSGTGDNADTGPGDGLPAISVNNPPPVALPTLR